jgi:hypothetical protein
LKKAAASFLLFIFLFNSMGYYFLFEVNRALVKREMTAQMQRSGVKLSILRISDPVRNPDFKRLDKREFLYQGKMYDILKEVKKGAVSIFYCIHDEKEQKLLAGFKKVCHSKLSHFLSEHVVKTALPVPGKIFSPLSGNRVRFPLLKNNICFADLLPATPPPEYI